MEHALDQFHAAQRASRLQPQLPPHLPLVIKQEQAQGALQHHKTLEPLPRAGPQVPVGAHVGAGLHHVQEALHQVRLGVQVVVAAQPGGAARLGGHRIKQSLVEALHGGDRRRGGAHGVGVAGQGGSRRSTRGGQGGADTDRVQGMAALSADGRAVQAPPRKRW